jgi:hypothetical protein
MLKAGDRLQIGIQRHGQRVPTIANPSRRTDTMKRSFQTLVAVSLALLAGYGLLPAQTGSHAMPTEGTVVLAQNDSGATPEKAAQPDIMIPDPLFTFDTVVDGTEVVHDFQVINRGAAELTIDKIETG